MTGPNDYKRKVAIMWLLFFLYSGLNIILRVALGIVSNTILPYIFYFESIFLIILLIIIMPSIKAFFRRAINCSRNRAREQKEAARLSRGLENENIQIQRLEELRSKGIREADVKRSFQFCRLMESLVGREQLQGCMAQVKAGQSVLDEIESLEKRMLSNAEDWKNAGDVEKCRYFMGLIQSEKAEAELAALEEQCREYTAERERERRAQRLWRIIYLTAVSGVVIFLAVLFVKDTPYRQLRARIADRTLTAEMFDRDEEESFYETLTTEKGYKLIASELTKLHRKDDAEKALWLMCMLPKDINEYELCASQSFAEWIVEYININGTKKSESIKGGWFTVEFSVDGYEAAVALSFGNSIKVDNIEKITISDGENETVFYFCFANYNRAVAVIK